MDNTVPPIHNNPPPVIVPPAPARRPRAGRGWKIFALVLLVALVVLVAVIGRGLMHLGFSSHTAHLDGRWLEEAVIENNHSSHKIAVIDVEGIITGQALDWSGQNMVEFIKDQLRAAADDDAVKAVVLKVDSPGGEVLASDEIYRLIADFQDKSEKPVVASMGGLAASGGYYVSAPCQWIVANDLTITGSIGVIMHSYNYRGLLNKVGVRPEVFKSGKFKDILSGEKELSEVLPEERQMIQALIDETFEKFKSVVAKGRAEAAGKNNGNGRELKADWIEYADGRIFSGKQALELGFVDELGNFQAAVKRARALAKIKDANLVHYQQPINLAGLFRLFGKTEAPAIKVDLGVDLPKLQVGRLYFISSSVLH